MEAVMQRLGLLMIASAVAFAAACGGSDGARARPAAKPSPGTVAATPVDGLTSLPDACALITSDQISELLGSTQGRGQTTGTNPQRSVCFYPSGVITTVEIVENYGASRSAAARAGRKTTDVGGVGKAAYYDEAGRLVATGERVFVTVTAPDVPISMLVGVVRVILEAAGETP
jgi:hypothetical protein